MRIPLLKLVSAVAMALGLSACANHPPMIPTSEASFVNRVNVQLGQTVQSTRIAEAVNRQTRREATRYGRSGAAKELRISVKEVHYKNALTSLLVGDANRIAAHVAVVDETSGRSHGGFDVQTIDMQSAALNGLSGMLVSAMQDKSNVDQRLATSLASDVMERVYGSAAAKEARKREPVEVAEIPEPAPAAAPPPAAAPKSRKPVAPKQTPVASAGSDRTAMIVAPVPQAR